MFYETEPQFNQSRLTEILIITNTIQKRNCKIYLDITNEFQHVITDECQTARQG